jgi:hypothetical protein
MYRTRSIYRKSGYYRIYDETTKPAPEASVLNVQPLNGWMERRGYLFGVTIPSSLRWRF